MKRLVMLLVLLLPSVSRGSDYVLASDGYYWLDSVAYTRTYVNGHSYYSGGRCYWSPGYYSYSKVVINKPATNPNDWRQEIAKAARERLEHQNFLESLKFAGLDAPRTAVNYGVGGYGSLQIGNYGVSGNTIYGTQQSLISLSDVYNSGDLATFYQQASRLAENAQSLAGQANLSFSDRLAQYQAGQAKVAEIVALGQLLQSMRTQSATKTEAKLEFKFNKDGKLEVLPEPKVEDGDVFKKWNTSAQRCSNCHFGVRENIKGGFDISTFPRMTRDQQMAVIGRLMLPKSDPKHMPKDGTPLSAAELKFWLDMVANKE